VEQNHVIFPGVVRGSRFRFSEATLKKLDTWESRLKSKSFAEGVGPAETGFAEIGEFLDKVVLLN
jgi:hypothetical protein